MSLYFIANNLHFALELVGALVFFVMAWLSVDAYAVSRNYSSAMRILGFFFVGVWQIIHAFGVGGDLVNFAGFFVYLIGLVLLLASFLTGPRLATVSAIILLPSFTSLTPFFEGIAATLLGAVSFLAYRQAKREFNKSLEPLWLGFLFLAVAALGTVIVGAQNEDNTLWYVAHALEAVGFTSFAFWVWQYLKLRVRESLVLIFISMTVFIATIVTLAFSTILIGKIEQETRNNLLINAKVFDFAVQGLTSESSAKAKLAAADEKLGNALSQGDLLLIESTLSEYLKEEHLGFILLTDTSGTVVMRAHSPGERGDSLAGERAVEEALVGNTFATIEFSPAEKFSIRGAAPVYQNGKIIGAIVAGYPLDNTMVDRIKKITGLDTTLYQGDLAIATTALSEDGRSRLTGEALAESSIKDNVLSRGENVTARVVIKDMPFLASYIPIINGDGKIVGMFSAAKPQADILEIANATNRLTLVTVTILLLLLAFPLYFLMRRLLDEL